MSQNNLPEPFRKTESDLSVKDKFCLFLGIVTLFPLRLIVGVPPFLLMWLNAKLGLIGMDETQPSNGYRRGLQSINLLIIKFISKFCFGFFAPSITGNLLPAKEAPIIIVAPHSSMFDGLVVSWLGSINSMCSVIVREEEKNGIFLGTIMRFHQMVFVKRSNKASKDSTVETIGKRAQNGAEWGRLIIFPEGTTSNGTSLLPFRRGSFMPGSHSIQPVIIRYVNNGVDCTTWTLSNKGLSGFLWTVVKAMSTLNNKVELSILPSVKPHGDPLVFGEWVRKYMGEISGLPLYNEDNKIVDKIFS